MELRMAGNRGLIPTEHSGIINVERDMNTVKVENGKVVGQHAPDAIAKCDRCGREFPAKYVYCVCRG